MNESGITSAAGTWGAPTKPEPRGSVVGVFAPWDPGIIQPDLVS
jgi:hypothetical protein